MRVLLIGTDRKLFIEGSSVHVRIAHLAHRYPEDIFEFIVFSTFRHNTPSYTKVAGNVPVHATNSFSRLLYGWNALLLAFRLPKPDRIEAQDPFETGLIGLIISRLLGVPLLVQVHTDFFSPLYARHSFLNWLRVRIAWFVLPRAVGGYVVSKELFAAVAPLVGAPETFAILPIFIDQHTLGLLPKRHRNGNLLWVGRFEAEKQPDLALRALAQARTAGHDVRLTMLGTGSLEGMLKQLAHTLQVTDCISFPGWGRIEEYLPDTELLLSTSAYEGFGMSVVEALSAGVPVLSTDVGIAREAGAIIAHGDFASALITWLSGPRLRGSLSLHPYRNEEEYIDRMRVHFDLYL